MIASLLLDGAAFVLAAGVAAVLVLLVWRKGISSVRFSGPAGVSLDIEAVKGAVSDVLQPVAQQVNSIDRQVNNVGPGERPLRQLVIEQGAAIDEIRGAVGALADRVEHLAAAAARHHPEDGGV